MFQNTYQNGTYFDVFDPKAPQQKMKALYRMINVHNNNKIFDKQLKTYVLQFSSSTSKISFPKQQKKDLYLIQQFLVLQIYLFTQMSWSIQLVVSDQTKTKRRILFSSSTSKMQLKPFFVKIPSQGLKVGQWNNICIDLFSFIQAFKGQQYRSLDCIYIGGHFKLRRIYTTTSKIIDIEGSQDAKQISFLPKNFYFPSDIAYNTSIVAYDSLILAQNLQQPIQPSQKNSLILKQSQRRFQSSPKSQFALQKKKGKEKNFLGNTNGSQMIRKLQKEVQQSDQSPVQKKLNTPQSTDKMIGKNKLGKTYNHKLRSSIQRKKPSQSKKQEKANTKAKLNPWRTNTKDIQTDVSQCQITKNSQRNIGSAQTTMFKTKNNLVSRLHEQKYKGIDKKSDFSDTQYVQLSQKFSTVTDDKFFKYGANECNKNQNDEIEQNIQMQTNSIYQNSNKKQQVSNNLNQIKQVLDNEGYNFQGGKELHQKYDIYRNSHYGFGQNLMKNFMGQIQRPYSPPIGQRQATQSQLSNKNEYHNQKQLELIYDPTLNCYYDHKTHTYYELKN